MERIWCVTFTTPTSTGTPTRAVDKALFSYQGKLPATKETAIVMMCDAVEAASKSLDKYTDETINTLVENIIGTQIKECAFAEAPITIKEIEEVKNTLKEKLKICTIPESGILN